MYVKPIPFGNPPRRDLDPNSLLSSQHTVTSLTEFMQMYAGRLQDPSSSRLSAAPFTPRDTGTPSWIEQQRVSRSLWRIQMLHDLKSTGWKGRLPWPQEALLNLDFVDLIGFYADINPEGRFGRNIEALGFAFWDTERTYDLRVGERWDEMRPSHDSHLFFTWWSILQEGKQEHEGEIPPGLVDLDGPDG
ncbi:hypothetical protein MKZ38_003782 [Zalerion maritima]|uniref:Uncharacterized protein n=1 Tax=Zalerion maritima TaxID=339359 RepID=A0AAD5RND2_9PEZI|nr:hypothetical protein MKZ38_003782 [Zalerion maritima]